MKASTVKVLCDDPSGKEWGTGSGFVIGKGLHVVTSWHVVTCAIAGVHLQIQTPQFEQAIGASLLPRMDARKDIAILELTRKLEGPLTLVPNALVSIGQRVYPYGYPPSATPWHLGRRAQGTLTEGIISGVVTDDNGVQLYVTDATINPGSSGGPVFDARGRVVGITMAKSIADNTENTGWLIRADELLPELKYHGISYRLANQDGGAATAEGHSTPLESASGSPGANLLIVLVITAGGAALVLGFGLRPALRRWKRRDRAAVPAAAVRIRGVSGHFAGAIFDLNDTRVVMGRDPETCQIVFPAPLQTIGRRHCTLHREDAGGTLTIEDCGSTNGTFVLPRQRLEAGRKHPLAAGDRFFLADREQMFEVVPLRD